MEFNDTMPSLTGFPVSLARLRLRDHPEQGMRMLIIRITENDLGVSAGEDNAGSGLYDYLRQQGVPPALIEQALDMLPQLTTLTLCKPSWDVEWEIRAGKT